MTVLATARRLDRLEDLAADLPPGKVIPCAGDLADPGFREQLWSRAEGLEGGLDLLVNNAGFGEYHDFAEQDIETIRDIFEINVMALMDLTQRAIRHMRPRGSGQILQISSNLGFVGLPYSSAYVATKHAVNGLVKSLRYELQGTGVRIWAACPGRTVSEFSRVAMGDGGVKGPLPSGARTDRVARAIVRGIDGRKTFLLTNFLAWAPVAFAKILPGPFDLIMTRWAPKHFRAEIDRARFGG